jgi:tricorn protease interacting factor F2/3
MFEPDNYRITLKPDLATFSFEGRVLIEGRIVETSDKVVLDANELVVTACTLQGDGAPQACAFAIHEEDQELVVSLPRRQQGQITLAIDYRGEINDKMAGFYRSRYQNKNDAGFVAVTQFQEHDARRAFPCFDHPGRKATFDIEMIVDENLTALSNGRVEEEVNLSGGKKRVRFEQTPIMSTYLLFLGVGPFHIAADSVDPRVRVVTLPGLLPQATYGLEFGREALRYCEDYYAIPYPLGKLDLIAVPEFAFGAMENWGAITFRENLLLRYPGITSRAGEERICEVIAHEIAHQWFGNLVSPSEWRYVWLNESFATLFGYGVIAAVHPEWSIWQQFLRGATAGALARDSMHETPAIEIPGGDQVVINTSTAPIVYSKGASILRQIRGHIGEDLFRAGLTHYLQSHAYGNTNSDDFWRAFEEVSEEPITDMMRSWVEQPGHPVVTAERRGRNLVLRQRRFTFLPGTFDQSWDIPVSVWMVGEDGHTKVLRTRFAGKEEELEVDADTIAYKVNAGQTGFYRVRYTDHEDLLALQPYIEDRSLGAEDRWGLQADLFAQVQAGTAPIGRYLRFLRAYRGEDAYLPATSIAANLMRACYLLEDTARKEVSLEGLPVLENALAAVGLEPHEAEPLTSSLLRAALIVPCVKLGSERIPSFARDLFGALRGGRDVHPDLLGVAMHVGAWEGEEETLDWFLERFRTSGIEQERLNILSALGSFGRSDLTERALRFALDEAPQRNRHIPIVSAAGNYRIAGILWRWYRENLAELESLHPLLYERVVASILPGVTPDDAEDARRFFADYVDEKPDLRQAVLLSLERLEVNLRMRRAGAGGFGEVC